MQVWSSLAVNNQTSWASVQIEVPAPIHSMRSTQKTTGKHLAHQEPQPYSRARLKVSGTDCTACCVLVQQEVGLFKSKKRGWGVVPKKRLPLRVSQSVDGCRAPARVPLTEHEFVTRVVKMGVGQLWCLPTCQNTLMALSLETTTTQGTNLHLDLCHHQTSS